MGASGWNYVTAYDGDVKAAVVALKARVFEEEYGDGDSYGSLAELYEDEEFMGTEGTHTVLDIPRTVLTADADQDGALRPLAADRVTHHFGTDLPTVQRYAELVAAANDAMSHQAYEQSLLGECEERWTGCYVVLHTEGVPTHLGVFGVSGD
ncbi:hypothetical protein [Streptomyces sp. SPB162]|uniref:hypothetical protein n=1 Tax=Streptomyces sp. SPB162 TaxID=2940560 RepID=UPI0024054B04|nr:hypothetical protein [Streptomyces sp. SPB162]MDF9815004.1 hypothetical protein [Streptomyces sp. SPB162]